MKSDSTILAADDVNRRVVCSIVDVFPGQVFEIQVCVKDLGGRKQEKPAVIAYRFKDEKSGFLDEAYSVNPYSRQLGARFRYVQYEELNRSVVTERIVTPVGATKLEMYVLTWQRKSAQSLDANLNIRFVVPSVDLLKKVARASETDVYLLLEAMLHLPLAAISIDSLRTAFDIAWANELLSLSWKIGQRLQKIATDRGARKTRIEVSRRLEYLADLSDVSSIVNNDPIINKTKFRHQKGSKNLAIRILSSDKKKLGEMDLIDEGHLYPAVNFSTVFFSPIHSEVDFGNVSLWSESTVIDAPWLIQTGLSPSFLSRASKGLLKKYAYSVMAAKLAEYAYGFVHAGPGVWGYELGEIGVELARVRGVPFIFEFDSTVLARTNGMKSAFREARFNKALSICKRANLVIFFDSADRSVLAEQIDCINKLIYIDRSDVNSASLKLEEAYRKVMNTKINAKS